MCKVLYLNIITPVGHKNPGCSSHVITSEGGDGISTALFTAKKT